MSSWTECAIISTRQTHANPPLKKSSNSRPCSIGTALEAFVNIAGQKEINQYVVEEICASLMVDLRIL